MSFPFEIDPLMLDFVLEEAMHYAMTEGTTTIGGGVPYSSREGVTMNDAVMSSLSVLQEGDSNTPTDTSNNNNDSNSNTNDVDLINTNNMTRNEQILMLQKQLDDLLRRQGSLQSSWEQDFWVTALHDLGNVAWHNLPVAKRRLRPYIKAILQTKSHLSYNILDAQYWNSQFLLPINLQHDRELLLLRLARPEFRTWYKEDSFVLPRRFWHDREMILAVVKAYPEILDQQDVVSQAFLRDADVFRALLGAFPILPFCGSADMRKKYLKCFAVELRQDASLMLEVLEHGISVFEALPKALRNNKNFALQAAEILGKLHDNYKIHYMGGKQQRRLKYFSQRLRACPEVVKAFCRDSGCNLSHATYKLRRNREIIITACRQNPNALQCTLKCGTRRQLLEDVSFWLDILQRQHDIDFCLDPSVYHMIPVNLWQNEDLVRAVIALMRKESDDVFLTPIWKYTNYWLDLAKRHNLLCIFQKYGKEQENRLTKELCLQILQLPILEAGMIRIFASQLEDDNFFSNPEYWRAIYPYQGEDVWVELAESLRGSPVLREKEILLHLFKDVFALRTLIVYVDAALLADRDLFEVALSTDSDCLGYFPSHLQLRYPELIVQCIEDACDFEELHEDIDEGLWENCREVFLAWIKYSDDDELYGLDHILEQYGDDEEIMLSVAKNAFDCLVDNPNLALMSDKSFLFKACMVEGRVWTLIEDEELKHDLDVALAAFGSSPYLPYECALGEDFSFLVKFARTVRNYLQVHSTFMKYILGSIDTADVDDQRGNSDCPLGLLNQGRETSLVYKKRIAEYVGLPSGERLRLLRSTSEKLAKWGF